MQQIPVITIDGPTASGKGTVASLVARELGFHYLDSGALYRLAALSCLRGATDLTDEEKVASVAAAMQIAFRDGKILLGEDDVTEAIRAEEVGVAASKVAALPRLRAALLDLQKKSRRAPGLVADGRDMGSVVFPDAPLKVFLTASAEARAERRYKQLMSKGICANLANLTADLTERDKRDRERKACPLEAAPGAKLLDNSSLSVEETVSQVLRWWNESLGR